MAKPLEITETNFEQEVITSDKLAVLDLWAIWCGPCRLLDPVFKELAEQFDDKAIIGKVNVDENPAIPQKYGVLNIPTILFIKNGELVDKIVGAVPKRAIVEIIEKYL